MLFQIFRALHGCLCYLHVMSLRRVRHLFLKFAMCINFVSAYFISRYVFKCQRIGLRRKKFHIYFVNIYCAARPVYLVELSITMCCFLSRYHGHQILFRFYFSDCRSFTSRKLNICTETPVSCINLIELMYFHFPNFVFF